MNHMYTGLLVVLLLTFSACHTQERAEITARSDIQAYFDVSGFFEAEEDELARRTHFVKTVKMEARSETQTLSNPNWEIELRPFYSADINRAAWLGKFAIDSIFNSNDELVLLSYTAQEEGIPLRRLEIAFADEVVQTIFIEKARKSLTMNSLQQLTYRPINGYTIANTQQTPLTEPFSMEVTMSW